MVLNELRAVRKSTLIWTVVLLAFAALYFSVFPGIMKDAEDFRNLMAGYPASARQMLGISLDTVTTLTGFYAVVFSFIVLCGAIQAMIFGASSLSRETRERTADFLLVKPVSRSAVVSAKLLAGLISLAVTDLFYFAGVFLMAELVKNADYSGKIFLLMNLVLLFVQLIFFSIGFLVSALLPRLRSVLPVSLGVVIGFYILGAVLITDSGDVARFFFPFKYFDFAYILNHAGYETPYLITGAAICAAAIALSYILFNRKDIHAVA